MEVLNKLDLSGIAAFLEGLEESIIYKILDRAQFSRNYMAYQPGNSGFLAFPNLSTLEIRLRMQEEMDARFGRFQVPEERPFTSNLPEPERLGAYPVNFPLVDYSIVSQNTAIYNHYHGLLDKICQKGDDGHYGSSVEHDVFALQAIARRIHYGAFYVSEAKFQADPPTFRSLARAGDDLGLLNALTRKEVEERILERVQQKVNAIQNVINPAVRRRIDPSLILGFYRDSIIPLTKQGELAYLKQRQDL
jgi:chorismate mutase